jgi:hypothetical protein
MPTPPPLPLPRIATPLSAEQVVDRLRTASKRGRMPGFAAGGQSLFSVAAHGQPFDGVLRGDLRNGHLEFSLRMLQKLPIIFAVVLALTIWPGVELMDGLIPGEWGWIPTWWWYIPITVLPIPWMWRNLMRRSRTAMHTRAIEAISKIAAETDGKVEASPVS